MLLGDTRRHNGDAFKEKRAPRIILHVLQMATVCFVAPQLIRADEY